MKNRISTIFTMTIVFLYAIPHTLFSVNNIIYEEFIKKYALRRIKENAKKNNGTIPNQDDFIKDTWKLTQEGGSYLYKIYHEKPINLTVENYQKALNAITTYLYVLSLPLSASGSGHSDTAIIIPDPKKLIYTFFVHNYKAQISKEAKKIESYIKKIQTQHLTHITNEHYGIVLNNYDEDHCVVIYDNEYKNLFIKLRNEPIGNWSLTKFKNGFNSYMSKTLHTYQSTDNGNDNKEHYIPNWVSQKYTELCPSEKNYTLAKIYNQFKILNTEPYKKICHKIRFTWNNIETRRGNEIFIDDIIKLTSAYCFMLQGTQQKKALEYYQSLLNPTLNLYTAITRYKLTEKVQEPAITHTIINKSALELFKNRNNIKKINCPEKLIPYYENLMSIIEIMPKSSQYNTTMITLPLFEEHKQKEILNYLQKPKTFGDSIKRKTKKKI